MKSLSSWLKLSCLSAGVGIAIAPVLLSVAPVRAAQLTSQPALLAQSDSALQTFRSQQLGFQLAYPKNYTVDATEESRGVIQLIRPGTTQQASTGEAASKSPTSNNTGKIVAAAYPNPNRLSPEAWARQNDNVSYITSGLQSNVSTRRFAGQNAISYSWCATQCGDSVIFPSRDGRVVVLSVVYDFPGDDVRWEFENVIGKFRFN